MTSANHLLTDNLTVNEAGHLCFAGYDVTALAEEYGTPCYFMDEERIRRNCRIYLTAADQAFDGKYKIMYASKAASFKRMYEIMREEGMGIDVVSCGEIYTAKCAGFPLAEAVFHSNNKTDADIRFALENGVGHFVGDNLEELRALEEIGGEMNVRPKVLLRLTPGIDTHTFAAVDTGRVDSKFGFSIKTGQAEEALELALSLKNVDLVGFHCHVGSQLFDSDVYLRSAQIMLEFIAFAKQKYGFITQKLDLGGGYGVKYVEADGEINIAENVKMVGAYMKKVAAELDIEMPVVGFEPGRSIVADAGLTLYTVGSLKKIPGFLNYVSVDGGMGDNIRYALYGSAYTLLAADKMNDECNMKCNVVGRCCESGDMIQLEVMLPEGIRGG
ncbi:MAG: diaminopimelate decarboxylase, partial [Clostridia bacterium]|nr:diaminopimelate decarboxylase [Clostridia bacterium]